MTAERVSSPRLGRRRAERSEQEDALAAPALTLVPAPPRRTTRPAGWAGRASSHRREQVRARGPEDVLTGPTGPVDSVRSAVAATPVTPVTPVTPAAAAAPAPSQTETQVQRQPSAYAAEVQQRWVPVLELLQGELATLSSVALCTTDGEPLAAFGIPAEDVATCARLTGTLFAMGSQLDAARQGGDTAGLDTVKLSSGETRTVIISVRSGRGTHLLSVTADGLSVGVMLHWTRQAAEAIAGLLPEAVEA